MYKFITIILAGSLVAVSLNSIYKERIHQAQSKLIANQENSIDLLTTANDFLSRTIDKQKELAGLTSQNQSLDEMHAFTTGVAAGVVIVKQDPDVGGEQALQKAFYLVALTPEKFHLAFLTDMITTNKWVVK